MRKRLNHNTLRHYLGDVPNIHTWSQMPQFRSDWGHAFDTFIDTRGTCVFSVEPRPITGPSRVSVGFLREGSAASDRAIGAGEVEYSVQVPLTILRQPREEFSLYSIRFWVDPRSGMSPEDSLPFRTGYIGITRKHPAERFIQHRTEMRGGRGYLLHHGWRSLLSLGCDVSVTLQVLGSARTLTEIYQMEEDAVREHTLVPKGLNAIPGGMEGIRRLHELRLLSNRSQVDPSIRDAALSVLETERSAACAHYRKGHIRHLSPERVTWVKPCWVNLDKRAA